MLLVLCSGCIAAGVKANAGVVSDGYGKGAQAGVSVSFGIAGEKSAVVERIGFSGGQAPKAGLDVGIDYVRFQERAYGKRALGWRAGVGGIPVAYGDPTTVGVTVATLFAVRDTYHSSDNEKWMSEATRNIFAFGVEAMLGMMVHGEGEMAERVLGGSASLTFEIYTLSTMH